MKSADQTNVEAHHDILTEYATAVAALHDKLHRIRHNQHHVAASLGRAAQALRSIAEGRPCPQNS